MITQTGIESELISRQAAIDAIDKCSVWVMYTQGDSQKDEAEFVESIIKQTKKAIKSMLIEDLPSAQPETCEGCKHLGKWENEVEYGYPSPCTRCKRRVEDHYER